MKSPELLLLLAQHPLIERLGWMLLHFVWQGALVALAAALLMFCLRGRSAAARYHVGLVALALMAVCPLATFALIDVTAPLPAAADDVSTPLADLSRSSRPAAQRSNKEFLSAQREMIPPVSAPAASSVLDAPEPPTAETNDRSVSAGLQFWLPYGVAGWLIGVISLALRLAGGLLRVRRLKTASVQRAEKWLQEMFIRLRQRMDVKLHVDLHLSALVRVPTVIGWLRPVVLVPAAALTSLTPGELEALLAHELAHVRRCDYLVNLLQSVVETLLFYHPGVWWLSRRIRQEREHCCDDAAAAAVGDRLVYVRALAQMAELGAAPHLAAAANGGQLSSRIRRLLGLAPAKSSMTSGWLAGIVVLLSVASLVAIPWVASRIVSAAQPEEKPATEESANDDEKGHVHDDQDPLHVKGHVIDVLGDPVADTTVILSVYNTHNRHKVETASARSDEKGRFEIELHPRAVESGRRSLRSKLWALAPDGRIAVKLTSGLIRTGRRAGNAWIVLAQTGAEDVVTVIDPEGNPVAGAVVEPLAFEAHFGNPTADYLTMPKQLKNRLRHVTNDGGEARWPAVLSRPSHALQVTTKSFGRQRLRFNTSRIGTRRIQLRSTGRLQGRLVCENPDLARGVTLGLLTEPPGEPRHSDLPTGLAVVKTDDAGRFEVPTIATGSIIVLADLAFDQPFRLRHRLPETTRVEAGRRASVELTLERATAVTATVQMKDDGSPVAGAEVLIASRYLQTDARGRCTRYVLPGKTIQWRVQSVPTGLFPASRTPYQAVEIPDSREEIELPTVEAVKAVTLSGRVVDERRKPVQGLNVFSSWLYASSRTETPTDENGRFSIEVPENAPKERIYFEVSHQRFWLGYARPLDRETLTLEFPFHHRALQGIWNVKALSHDGESQATDTLVRRQALVSGGVMRFLDGGKMLEKYVYKLDASVEPGTITLTRDKRQLHGIYRIRGDELTLCINTVGEIPTEFAAAGSVDLYTLRRDHAERRLANVNSIQVRNALLGGMKFEFINTPLNDIVDYLQELHGIEIEVDVNALTAAGLKPDLPVTSNISGVALDTALRMMLSSLGLRYEVRGNTIFFTTAKTKRE